MLKTLVRRIEVAESAAVGRLRFSEDCICFPANEPAVFFSDEEQETAYRVNVLCMAIASKNTIICFGPLGLENDRRWGGKTAMPNIRKLGWPAPCHPYAQNRVNEFYKKGCQEKSAASTGVEICFSRSSPLGLTCPQSQP